MYATNKYTNKYLKISNTTIWNSHDTHYHNITFVQKDK